MRNIPWGTETIERYHDTATAEYYPGSLYLSRWLVYYNPRTFELTYRDTGSLVETSYTEVPIYAAFKKASHFQGKISKVNQVTSTIWRSEKVKPNEETFRSIITPEIANEVYLGTLNIVGCDTHILKIDTLLGITVEEKPNFYQELF